MNKEEAIAVLIALLEDDAESENARFDILTESESEAISFMING
jgi:hypothetical protein